MEGKKRTGADILQGLEGLLLKEEESCAISETGSAYRGGRKKGASADIL